MENNTYTTGWVYVLSHSNNEYLKIGFTTKSVELRIKELHSDTGALFGYKCQYAILVRNPRQAEKKFTWNLKITEYGAIKNSFVWM